MTFQQFKRTFDEILYQTPLPNGDYWKMQQLANASLQADLHWFEVLYRTRARFQCDHGHGWQSSWSMIVFRFHLNPSSSYGRVRMKRFGQGCGLCKNNDNYYTGICSPKEVWLIVQRLLFNILQRCYEGRDDWDVEDYIIPISDVPAGKFGGARHKKESCEACYYNRCQEMYKRLTKKK